MLPQPTAQAYSPPSVRQYSVFLENKVGRLLDLLRLFEEEPGLHLCGLSVLESSDHAVVRLIPSSSRKTDRILRDHEVPFSVLDLLIVELTPDHSLTSLCMSLIGAELNIRFAYPLLLGDGSGCPTIAIAVDDNTLAGQILRRKAFRLLGEADLV